MNPHSATEFIQAAGAVVAAGRVIRLGLASRYPAIFVYLVAFAVMNADFGLLNTESAAYFFSYVIFEPVKCVLSVLAVRELFTLIFEGYPGIRTVGRWVMYAAVALALSVSLAATIWGGGPKGRSRLFYLEVSQRWIVFTLAFVICGMLFCLSRYPLRLRENTVISCVFFSALFLSDACQLLIDSIAPHFYNLVVDWSQSVVSGVCLLFWAVLLRPEGEIVPVTFSSLREDHLLQQLTALNQVMARAARR